jgi:hypothetical protein
MSAMASQETKNDINQESADSRNALQDRLELMRQLEASLCKSHQALAALDLAGIRQGTRDQWSLCRSLGLEMRQVKAAEGRHLGDDTETSRELRRSEWKVLEAARLQAALLKRAQRKLAVIANMLAGAERNYGPPVAPRQALPCAPHREKQG